MMLCDVQTHEELNLELHGSRTQREHFGARSYCIAGEVNENVHIGSPDHSCNLQINRMRGASVCGKMVDEICMASALAAHFIESQLRNVDHALVAPRGNAVAFWAVVASAAAVANDVELRLIVVAEVGMQRANSGGRNLKRVRLSAKQTKRIWKTNNGELQ
jgi:hypothetical protein